MGVFAADDVRFHSVSGWNCCSSVTTRSAWTNTGGFPTLGWRRIVSKVDELMGLCNKLDGSLASAAELRRGLLDALIAAASDA